MFYNNIYWVFFYTPCDKAGTCVFLILLSPNTCKRALFGVFYCVVVIFVCPCNFVNKKCYEFVIILVK